MTRNSLLRVAAIATLCAPVVVAAADRLNVRTGLWEIRTVSEFNGVIPLPKEVRDKLTPEQLAKMSAELQAATGPTRDTSRECITEKDLDHPFDSSDAKDCRQTITKTTRTTQEVQLVCAGEHKGTGVLRVSAPTPETMNGTIDISMGDGADKFTMKGTLSGHWLSADCGDEADRADDTDDEDDEPADDNEEEEE
ncbi:MAG TPA: DUF3617 family protein [Povalibacter sp.]|nr:DUF3617 family protein [Povalibacter sp.]